MILYSPFLHRISQRMKDDSNWKLKLSKEWQSVITNNKCKEYHCPRPMNDRMQLFSCVSIHCGLWNSNKNPSNTKNQNPWVKFDISKALKRNESIFIGWLGWFIIYLIIFFKWRDAMILDFIYCPDGWLVGLGPVCPGEGAGHHGQSCGQWCGQCCGHGGWWPVWPPSLTSHSPLVPGPAHGHRPPAH